jgi:YidC/Oxa1 family membrane protein insertase
VERRYVTFIILAGLILVANQFIVGWLFPKPKLADKAQKPPEARQHDAAPAAADDEGANRAEATTANEAKPTDAKPPAKPGAEAVDASEEPEEKIAVQRLSLGSYLATSGYRLLVTLNNQGAAVERVELTSPQYRDLEDRSGYLGHLAPADAPDGGCLVQVVGRGTPADAAGLKPGDKITRFGPTAVASAADFVAALGETVADQTISLTVVRDGKELSIEAKLDRRPLEIIRPEFDSKPLDVADKEHDPLSLLLTLSQAGGERLKLDDTDELAGVHLREAPWQVDESDEDHVVFSRSLPALAVKVTKRYRLAKAPADADSPDAPDYHLFLDVELHNLSDKKQTLAYRLEGPTGLPLEGAWYSIKISRTWGAAGMRDVIARFAGNSPYQVSCPEIADGKKIETWVESDSPLDYLAVDTQYFAAALIPKKENPKDIWFDEIKPVRVGAKPAEKSEWKKTDVSFRLTSKPIELAPQGTFHHEFELFAGPKKPAILDQYAAGDTNLGELVYYGWFGFVAKPMLGILHLFYHLVRNYGLAIVMLTVLVRGCMFPLSRRQAQSSQKMAELKPEIQRIQEKHKDPTQRNKAMQEMYRKHNFNPFGSCLLVFVQMPIFVGLYRSLGVDVELRQAPLISSAVRWCSNLAAPDMLWNWHGVVPGFIENTLGLGPYLNVFPFLTIGLFIWQQKMFMPPPTDEQSAMQQKMMSYMSIVFGFMFYKVASGLCLYFIVSSLWGIAERKALPQSPAAAAGGSGGGGSGGSGKRPGVDGGGNGSPSSKRRQPGRK